jgi:hypothetical protein
LISSVSGKRLRVAAVTSHIDDNTTPMKNAPKKLSTGIEEGICGGKGMELEAALRNANSQ